MTSHGVCTGAVSWEDGQMDLEFKVEVQYDTCLEKVSNVNKCNEMIRGQKQSIRPNYLRDGQSREKLVSSIILMSRVLCGYKTKGRFSV